MAYAALLGVFVDLDHFAVSRLRTGDWSALTDCLRHPVGAFTDQTSIFAPDEVGKLPRLLSHALVGGVVVAAWAPVAPRVAVLSALVLYAHVVSDLVADVRQVYGDAPLG